MQPQSVDNSRWLFLAGAGGAALIALGVIDPATLPLEIHQSLTLCAAATAIVAAILFATSRRGEATSRQMLAEFGRLRSSEREIVRELTSLKTQVAVIKGDVAKERLEAFEAGYDEGFLAALGRRDS